MKTHVGKWLLKGFWDVVGEVCNSASRAQLHVLSSSGCVRFMPLCGFKQDGMGKGVPSPGKSWGAG